jgi:hypothetical protein
MREPRSNILELCLTDRHYIEKLQSICQDAVLCVGPSTGRPDRLESARAALIDFWSDDHNLTAILETVAYVGADHPFEAIEIFRNSLPRVALNEKTVPKAPSGKISFTERVQANWTEDVARVTVRTVTEVIFAVFVRLVLTNSGAAVNCQQFIDTVRGTVCAGKDEEISAMFQIVSARYFAGCFGVLSSKFPAELLESFIQVCLDVGKCIHTKPAVDYRHWATALLLLYSQIAVTPETAIDLKRVETALTTVFGVILRKVGSAELLHTTAIESLTNVLDSIFVASPAARESPVIWKAIHFASTLTKSSGYHGPGVTFYAMLSCFCEVKQLAQPARKFWRHWFEGLKNVTATSAGTFLAVCHFFLKRGETSGIFAPELRGQVVQFIAQNPALFSNHAEALARLFVRLVSIDGQFAGAAFAEFTKEDFVKFNTRALIRLGVEISNPRAEVQVSANDRASLLKGLQVVVDSAMQEGLSKKGEDSFIFQVSSFLPIFQSKAGKFDEALLSIAQDSQPLSFRLPTDALANRTLIQRWSKPLGMSDARIFKSVEVGLRGYSGMKNQDALLCQALAILPVFPPNELFMVRVMSLLFSSSPFVAAFAHRLLQVFFIGFERFRLSIVNNLLKKIWKSVSLTPEHLYTLLNSVLGIFSIASAFDFEFQEQLDVEMNLMIVTCLCSESSPVRDLALQIASQYRLLSPGYSIDQLIDDCSDHIEQRGKRMALMSVSHQSSFNNFPNLRFRDVAKSSLNHLYEYYFTAFASSFLLKSDAIKLRLLHGRIWPILNGLFRDRCSNYLCGNFVSFVINSAHPDIIESEPFLAFVKTAIDSQRIVNPLTLFPAFHPRVRELCYSLSLPGTVYIRAQAFSIRVLACDDDSVTYLFGTLEHIVDKAKAFQLDIEIVQNVILAATILFDVIFTRLGEFPAGPYLRKKVVTNDVSQYFSRDLWYPFIMEHVNTPFGQRGLASLLSVAPPSQPIFQSVDLSDYTGEALAAILARWTGDFLARFIMESLSSTASRAKYFMAILSLFVFGDKAAMVDQLIADLSKGASSEEGAFTSTVFCQTGSLLALAFTYITRETGVLRTQAYQLMVVIAIGAALCVGKATWAQTVFTKSIEEMFTVRSQLTNLYLPALVSISTQLVGELDFCTEQFIAQILLAIRNEEAQVSKLARIVAPWVHGARFAVDQPIVFPQTDPLFAAYTFYALLRDLSEISVTSDMFLIIDNLLNIPDQKAVIGYVTRCLYTFYQENGDKNKIMAFLSYILQHRPEETSSNLVEFFRLPIWYYYRLSDKESTYEHGVEFAAKSMSVAYREFPDRFQEHYAASYAYSLVNLEKRSSSELLPSLLPVLDAEGSDNEAAIFREFQKLGAEFQEKLGKECLLWGVCCGDLSCASRALLLYRRFLLPLSPDLIRRLVMNIRLVTRIASEKSSPVLVDYVTNCWETLRMIASKLESPSDEVFDLCCEFLSCTQPDILSIIFTIMSYWLTFLEMIEKLRNRERSVLLRGKLRTAFELETGEGFFTLLLSIARADLASVVATNDIITIVLLLVMPLYGRRIQDRGFFAIAAVHANDPEVSGNLTKLSLMSEDDVVLMFETALVFAHGLNDEDLQVVCNLLGSLLSASNFKHGKFIYSFVISLLSNRRLPTCFMYFVALTERDTENEVLRSHMMELFVQANGLKVRVHSDPSCLPVVECKDALAGVKMVVDFQRFDEFPPLLVTGAEFAECQTERAVKDVVKNLVIEPMNSWFLEIGKAQQVHVDSTPKRTWRKVEINGMKLAEEIRGQRTAVAPGETAVLHVICDEKQGEDNILI